MLRKTLTLVAVVSAALILTIPSIQLAGAVTVDTLSVELNCLGVIDLGSSLTADRDNTGVDMEAYTIRGTDGYGNTIFEFSSSVSVGFSSSLGSFAWSTPPGANPLTLQMISHAGNGYDEQIVFTVTGECTGLPWPEPEVAIIPGCDVLLPIPATAVGGAFVANAPVYWQPGELTNPLVTIAAGNTARVIGLDASGQYYKIIWGCDFVWVPKATMGPNYDAVWNGAPLPTAVVE